MKYLRVLSMIMLVLVLGFLITSTEVAAVEGEGIYTFIDGEFRFIDKKDSRYEEIMTRSKRAEIEAAKEKVDANPTKQRITVDGKPTEFRAYAIEGNNYFMLRDIAHIFKGTKAQFEVGWDGEKFAINLEVGKKYTGQGIGFGLKTPHVKEQGTKSRATIYKDGEEILLLGYTIEGYTYFKLRDLGDALNFGVAWDNANRTVVIAADKASVEGVEEKKETVVVAPEEPKVEEEEEPINPYTKWDAICLDDVVIRGVNEEEEELWLQEMLRLVNEARVEEGLVPLVLDRQLVAMSQYKVRDMHKLDEMNHDGTYTFRELVAKFGQQGGGENILVGQRSPFEMFNDWMNSPGHRANILRPEYRRFGFAVYPYMEMELVMAAIPDLHLLESTGTVQIPYRIEGRYLTKTMRYWGAQNFGF